MHYLCTNKIYTQNKAKILLNFKSFDLIWHYMQFYCKLQEKTYILFVK